MPTFTVNQTRTTEEPSITVETLAVGSVSFPSPFTSLFAGQHRFQLVVEDNSGNRSEPAFVDVTVTATTTGGVFNLGGFGSIGGLDR